MSDEKYSKLNGKIMYISGSLSERFSRDDITPHELINIVTQAMIIASEFNSVSGSVKKRIVLSGIKMFVGKLIKNEDDKEKVLDILDAVGPTAIDSIVWAADQKIVFNRKSKWYQCCCKQADDPA